MAEINTNLDTTPLPPNNLVAQDPQSAELAGYVRTKTFGRDVRESIARSIELNSTRSKSAEILANETVNVANDLTDRFNQQIGALTEDSEVIDARGGKATLGKRLDETDAQLAQTDSNVSATNKRVDELVIGSGDANAEVTDAHVSSTKNKTFTTIRNRLEDVEKDVTIPISNIIKNGNFAGLSYWPTTGSNKTVANNELTFTATVQYGQVYQDLNLVTGHKYYVKAHVKSTGPVFLQLFKNIGSDHTGSGEYELISGIDTATSNNRPLTIGDNRASGWEPIKVKNVMVVDLTTTFGLGNEPTKEEFEKIISSYENMWFENGNVFNAKYTLSSINNSFKRGNPRLIFVDKNGFGDYTTITEAITNANARIDSEVTIVVLPGIYNETLKLGGQKYISLIGVNKRKCIVKDSTGLRVNAPLEISGNTYVANLTFHATFTDESVVINNLGSYGVHVDYAGEGTTEFFNCNIISDCSSAIGAGTLNNQKIIFNNCYIESNSKANYMSAWCYAVFLHGSGTASHVNQKFVIKNCEIRGVQDRLLRLANVGSDFEVEFINNMLWSNTIGKSDGTVFSEGSVTFSPASYGNNVAILNK